MTNFLQRFNLFSKFRSRNLVFLGAIALGCLSLIAAFIFWFSPQITLGLVVPLTGDFAVLAGKDIIAGAELAVKQANQAGGISLGDRTYRFNYRVKLAIADDRNLPQGAVRAAEKLRREGAIALISSPKSSLALSIIQDLPNFPLVTAASGLGVTANQPSILGLGLPAEAQGNFLAIFARKTLKAKRAAILYDPSNSYSQAIAQNFQRTFQELEGLLVAPTTYLTTYKAGQGQDLRSQLLAIAEQKPDVLLLPNYLPDLISQGQQLQELNLKIPTLGGDAWAGLISANLPLLEGGFFLSPWHLQIPSSKNQQFVQNYTRLYKQSPRTNAALTYDAVQMLLGAIALALSGGYSALPKATTPEMIVQGYDQIQPFLGVTGTISKNLGRSVVINQIKNGEAKFYQQLDPQTLKLSP